MLGLDVGFGGVRCGILEFVSLSDFGDDQWAWDGPKFIDLRFGNPFLNLSISSISLRRLTRKVGGCLRTRGRTFQNGPKCSHHGHFSAVEFLGVYSFSICMKSQLHLHCESTSKWNPIQFLHLFFDVFGTVACVMPSQTIACMTGYRKPLFQPAARK